MQVACSSRSRGTTPGFAGATLAERPVHGLGGQSITMSNTRATLSGTRRPRLPLLKSPHVETETVGKLLPAQPQPLAERDNTPGGGILDDLAWQRR